MGVRAILPSHSVPLLSHRHMLVVFGGLQGLEAGVDADPNLEVTDPSVLFDFYLNTCPSQGSRTIRTEVRQGADGMGAAVPVCTEHFCLWQGHTANHDVVPHSDASAKSCWLAQQAAEGSSSDCALVCFRKHC